ncbi:CHORISMATE SYNTHASE [Salix viminalis]|uniref:CHORISMATE SYNTHASE n=1 Tax=Salix viminalis TaxID=40686 RepID=A0A9Q0SEZ4_SALVM|nr:CHORISMATE SYNTHASE [Salix viminalis]
MSLQNDDLPGPNQHVETSSESRRKLKTSYTREFLLSLSELDVCKNLPSGFDQSLLSEFEDTSQDRYRIPGSASSQSYRANDYSSSPPTRGDSSNFSRGIHGRWDSRSSGRSDRDSDSQSDWDPVKQPCALLVRIILLPMAWLIFHFCVKKLNGKVVKVGTSNYYTKCGQESPSSVSLMD